MKSAPAKPKNAPTELRAQRTRGLILKAGLDCIMGGGLNGFTANELMRRTGLSKGALFHHFQSLDDIALECALMAEHLVAVEMQGSLKEALEQMMNVPYAFKRVRALGGVLFFLCEKARGSAKFRKVMNRLNEKRCESIREMLKTFCPHLKDDERESITQLVHSNLLGLAGPSGECMNHPQRLKVWEYTVRQVVALTARG